MGYRFDKNIIALSRKTIKRRGGIVILDLKEYQELYERAIPTYYLEGKEAEELDELVKEGVRDYKRGKTVEADSLKEALQTYGKRKKNK